MIEQEDYSIERGNTKETKGIFKVYIGYDTNFGFRMHGSGKITIFRGDSHCHKLCNIPEINGIPKNPYSGYSPYYKLYEELISLASGVQLEETPEIVYSQD